MPVSVTVIDIDLGSSIEEIIQGDARAITMANDAAISKVVQDNKAAKTKVDAKQKELDDQEIAMTKAYEALVENKALNRPMPWAEISKIIMPSIANATAFAGRIRAILRHRGSVYRIESSMRNRERCYSLVDFNKEPTGQEIPLQPEAS